MEVEEKPNPRAARDIDISAFSAVVAAVNAWHEGVEEEEWSKTAHVAVETQAAFSPRAKSPGTQTASSPRVGKGSVFLALI